MKLAIVVACAFALSASFQVEAIRPDDFINAVLEQQTERDIVHPLLTLIGGQGELEKGADKKGAYALVKFIVKPTLAKGFIEAFESSKKAAEKYDGYLGYYLVKTVDDNITYISWAAWESIEDFARYIKSDDARELIEYTAKEDIVTLISGVRPIA